MTEANENKSSPKTATLILTNLHCNDGIASYIELLTTGLRSRGWRTTLAAGCVYDVGGSSARHERLRALMDVWTVDPRLTRLNPRRPWTIINQAKLIREIGKAHHADILHLNGRALAPACWLNKKWTGVPFVNTMHTGPAIASRFVRPLRKLLGPLLGDRYITISRETAEQAVSELGVPAKHLRIVHHGFAARFRAPSPQERADARTKLGLRADQFVCVVVARIGLEKRHDLILRALSRIRTEIPEFVALFVGEGDESIRLQLDKLIAELGLTDNVRFLGHTDPLPILWASDVKILASDFEGFPLVIPEAMACAVVPVRTNCGGALDQIDDGRNGLLFACGDDDALAGHLKRLALNKDERLRMGAAAHETALKRFSQSTMVENTLNIYCELLNRETASEKDNISQQAVSENINTCH